MRIILVNKYWYLRGGAERVLFATKDLLESAGHTVRIFGMQHPDNIVSDSSFIPEINYSTERGLGRLRTALQSIYNCEAKARFATLVKEFRPDVVHWHNIYHQLSFSLLDVVRDQRIPSVMTLHDYKMVSPNYNLFHHGHIAEESLGGHFYRCLTHNAMEDVGMSAVATVEAYVRQWKRYADVIGVYISPSVFLQQKFVAAGWRHDRIEVIRNPIDVRTYPPALEDNGYVAYVGRLALEKGAEILYDVARQTPKIPYRFIGTGHLLTTLQTRLASDRLSNVTMDGFKTGEALRSLLMGARIIVVPSLWYENYPQIILEAKALGKIVIGSDIGGISELLPSELLVSPGDPVALCRQIETWYATTPLHRERMGQQLRHEVERDNSPATYQERLMSVYESL